MRSRWIFVAAACVTQTAVSQVNPPPSAVEPVVDEYGNTSIVDNYRWLEQADSPDTAAWVRQQNAYARSFLDRLPDREAIRTIKHGMESGHHVFYWNIRTGKSTYFALKTAPPREQPVLVALSDPDDLSTERTVVDPLGLDAGGELSINWYRPSPDGKFVAVCLTDKNDRGDVYVFDAATGKTTGDVVPRVSYPSGGGTVSWLDDSRGFLYTRYPRPGERPEADLEFYAKVYRHMVGTPTARDSFELGEKFLRLAEIRLFNGDAGWQFARVAEGDEPRFAFYARTPQGRWMRFLSPDDDVVQVAQAGNKLLLLSTKKAPRGEVLALALRRTGPDRLKHASRFAEQPAVAAIQSIIAPQHATPHSRVLLVEHDGGPDQVEIRDLAGARLGMLAMPPVSEFSEWAAVDDKAPIYCVSQYVAPMQCFREADRKPLAISEQASVRLDDIDVIREFATSADGTRIPLTILHRKGLPLRPNTPTVMTGYGEAAEEPWFNVNLRLYADAGVTWVDTNVRGGNDYGQAWRAAGEMLHKQRTFDDFVACARRLIELGYTDPGHLVIEGSSAGGLLVGVAMTQHPELFKGVVGNVGIYDTLRVELDPNGQFNTMRYGSTRIPEQFAVLYSYSPYHHVIDKVHYPDVLFLASGTDSHVDPMHSRKMTARLQAAVKGRSLVLLRTSASDGHGTHTAFSEQVEQDSDAMAFEFFELGMHLKP